jgi:hypothetical protein
MTTAVCLHLGRVVRHNVDAHRIDGWSSGDLAFSNIRF